MHDASATISDLLAGDWEALYTQLELGERICEHYLPSEKVIALEVLDKTLDAWFQDNSDSGPTPNQVALGIGSLFGQEFCQSFQCSWVIVESQGNGCDLALSHIETERLFFPIHSVAKRLDKTNFGQAILQKIFATLGNETGLLRTSD